MNRSFSTSELVSLVGKDPVWVYRQNTEGCALDFTDGRCSRIARIELLECTTDDYIDVRTKVVLEDGSVWRLADYGRTWIAFREKLYEPLPAAPLKVGEWAVVSDELYLCAFETESGLVTSLPKYSDAVNAVKACRNRGEGKHWRVRKKNVPGEYVLSARMPFKFGTYLLAGQFHEVSWDIIKVTAENKDKLAGYLVRLAK